MVLNNAKSIMKQILSSGETKGLVAVKDVGNTTRYIADFSAYPAVVEDSFTLTAADAGISVGSGTTAVNENDYQLESTITSGLTGSVATSSLIDSDGNAYVMFAVTLTNTTASDISVSEIGCKQEISASDTLEGTTTTDRVVLIDRTVFNPITIAAGGQAIIGYRIKSVVASETGVLITKTITSNGAYQARDEDADGYSRVTVNVQPNLGTKTITTNGTYTASAESLDGYSAVTVNVPSGGSRVTSSAEEIPFETQTARSTISATYTITSNAQEVI